MRSAGPYALGNGAGAKTPFNVRPPSMASLVFPGFGFPPSSNGSNPNSAPGDWRCPNMSCINSSRMVFAKHSACPKCGTPKESAVAAAPAPHMQKGGGWNGMPGMSVMSGNSGNSRPGDWQCPNTECLNHRNKVFGKHDSCPACGQDKPLDFGS